MTKEEYINRILCEHWFRLTHWKGRKWDKKRKQTWLSGMHRAWNVIYPSNKIELWEIVNKVSTWSREEAEQWYTDFLSEKKEDDGIIETRWEILDL